MNQFDLSLLHLQESGRGAEMRQKRQLNGKIIKTTTIRMRASVRDKVDSFTPPGGSFVNTLEQMVEYLYARRQRRREKQHNRENS